MLGRRITFAISTSLAFTLGIILPCQSSAVTSQSPGSTDTPLVEKVLSVKSVQNTKHGGKAYTYDINGVKTIYLVPPAGFNPVTASDDELAEYGFSPRPRDADSLKLWNETMSHCKYCTAPVVKVTNQYNKPRKTNKTSASAIDEGNEIWSGYVTLENYNNTNNDLNDAWGDYIQPAANTSSSATSDEVSWVGIGGNSQAAPGLIQCGTRIRVTDGSARYTTWYEYWGTKTSTDIPITETSVGVSPGDAVHLEARYDPSTGRAYMNILNESTGHYAYMESILPRSYYSGTTAEWIDERPSYALPGRTDYTYEPLTNFGTIKWVNC